MKNIKLFLKKNHTKVPYLNFINYILAPLFLMRPNLAQFYPTIFCVVFCSIFKIYYNLIIVFKIEKNTINISISEPIMFQMLIKQYKKVIDTKNSRKKKKL